MADCNDCSSALLVDPDEHLDLLNAAFSAGDILALFQVIDFVQEQSIVLPTWVINPLEDTLQGILTLRQGKPGRGNTSFGQLRKDYLKTVRASAYRYVRSWQRDPHQYENLPRRTIEDWYSDKISWSAMRTYSDAARLAATGLHGTEFQANASTVRKAADRFPSPVLLGRSNVESRFGLRGSEGLFGPNDARQPEHVKKLLASRKPKK